MLSTSSRRFITTPINQLVRAILNDDKAKYEEKTGTQGIVPKGDEKQLTASR